MKFKPIRGILRLTVLASFVAFTVYAHEKEDPAYE